MISDSSTSGQIQIDLGAARRARAPTAAITSLEPLERHGARVDRLAARRLLGQARDIEIAIGRQHQGARDRRRASSPAMSTPLALVGEPQALLDAEAVLLVDHGQRQVVEGDVVLEQRMGADDDRRSRPRARPASIASRALPLSRPVSSATDAGRRGERLQGRVMLAREDLGRRHQRRLRAGSRPRSASPAARRRSCRCRHRPAAAASCGAAPPCRRRSRRSPALAAPVSAKGRAASTLPRSAPVPASARPGAPLRCARTRPAPADWRAARHRRAARRAGASARDRPSPAGACAVASASLPGRPFAPFAQRPGRSIPAARARARAPPATAFCRTRGVRPAVSG